MLTNQTNTLAAQLKRHWRSIAVILALSLTLIGAAAVIHWITGAPFSDLTRDPASAVGKPFYTGFISQAGIVFWIATAVICLWSAWVLYPTTQQRQIIYFLGTAGLLTIILAVDDAFLLHEGVLPNLGVPEWVAVLAYGLLVAFLFIRFSRLIFTSTPYLLLIIGLTGFAASIALDFADIERFGLDPYLLEDSSKLIGIIAWFMYYLRVALDTVRAQRT